MLLSLLMIHFNDAHTQFVAYLGGKNRAESTILAYGKDIQQMLGHIEETHGKTHVHHIDTDDINSFLEMLEKEEYTKKSISRKINSIKTFFRFLKTNDFVIDDPSAVITHPKFQTPPPRILSKTEYRALRDAARDDTRTFAIIEILLQTGVRIGELAAIKVDEITIDDESEAGTLFIPESRTTLGREIPLNKAAAGAIRTYLDERPSTDNDHLLVTRTGKPLLVRNIRASIDRYFERAGIEGSPKVNDLRHTWIAHHIKSGTSLVTISKLAGHKRLATTEKYLEHIDAEQGNGVSLEEL